MKKLLKKLSALALAGAMVLSLGTTALATDATILGGGNVNSTGQVENTKLEKPILLTMPVLTNDDVKLTFDPHGLIQSTNAKKYGTDFTFDFGGGKSYTSLSDTDGTPMLENNLFFKNGDKSYGPFSKSASIINKSDMDVGVKLSVEVTKGANDGPLVFANSAAAAKAMTGVPAIYLAVGSGSTASPATLEGNVTFDIDATKTVTVGSATALISAVTWTVADYELDTDTESDTAPTDSDDEDYASDLAKYNKYLASAAAHDAAVAKFVGAANAGISFNAYSTNDTASVLTVDPIDGYLIEESETAGTFTVSVDGGLDEDGEPVVGEEIGSFAVTAGKAAANTTVSTTVVVAPAYYVAKDESAAPVSDTFFTGLKFAFADGSEEDVEAPDAATQKAFSTALTASGQDVKAKWTKATNLYEITMPTLTGYSFDLAEDNTVVNAGENVYTVSTVDGTTKTTIGTLTVTLAKASGDADIAEKTGNLKVTYAENKVATAEIKGVVADAGLYIDDYDNPDSGTASYKRVLKKVVNASGEEVNPTADDFNKVVFYLTGNINSDDAWDNGATAASGAVGSTLGVKLIWDVQKASDEYTDTLSDEEPAAGNVKPSVEVTAKATSGSAATSATLKVNMGTGDLKASSVTFKQASTTLTYADTGVLTIPKANASKTTGWTATFTYADESTYVIDFDPFTVGVYDTPTA